jgi:hypothetical protein
MDFLKLMIINRRRVFICGLYRYSSLNFFLTVLLHWKF